MTDNGRSPWLLGGAIALGTAILALVGWGQVKPVEVPWPLRWTHAPVLFAAVDSELSGPLEEALELWRKNTTHRVRLARPGETVDVVVHVDPALDVLGRASVQSRAGKILTVSIAVRPRPTLPVLLQEIGHSLGYGHPIAAPSGHIMRSSDPGSRDWRGLEGGDPSSVG